MGGGGGAWILSRSGPSLPRPAPRSAESPRHDEARVSGSQSPPRLRVNDAAIEHQSHRISTKRAGKMLVRPTFHLHPQLVLHRRRGRRSPLFPRANKMEIRHAVALAAQRRHARVLPCLGSLCKLRRSPRPTRCRPVPPAYARACPVRALSSKRRGDLCPIPWPKRELRRPRSKEKKNSPRSRRPGRSLRSATSANVAACVSSFTTLPIAEPCFGNLRSPPEFHNVRPTPLTYRLETLEEYRVKGIQSNSERGKYRKVREN